MKKTKIDPDNPKLGQVFYAFQSSGYRAGETGFCCSTQCNLEVSVAKAVAQGKDYLNEIDEMDIGELFIWEMKRVR